MKIAIEGCCHGQLDDIYGTIKLLEKRENTQVDLVLICGDFQALRNTADVGCMAVPDKYKTLGSFWKYYAGLVKAPYPTVFIGGNHEASNYLWELHHGGWVCENIYYLGNTGVISYNGVRIGGLSGIYKDRDYHKGHYERSPYTPSDVRTVYHYREYDVKKLLQIRQPLDIFLSHDWPRGVERYGDVDALLRVKKYFYEEIRTNTLGSPANEELLTHLKPDYWFSAHLHVKYAAYVDHSQWNDRFSAQNEHTSPANSILQQLQQSAEENNEQLRDTENAHRELEQVNDGNDTHKECEQQQETNASKVTRFLSLDKCLPRRSFLQVIDVPSKNDEGFAYDLEWLAITRAMHPYLSLQYASLPTPVDDQLQIMIQQESMNLDMQLDFGELDLRIPSNFKPTARPHDPNENLSYEVMAQLQQPYLNPQTTTFCELIGLENKINAGGQPPDVVSSSSITTSQSDHVQNVPASEQEQTFTTTTEQSSTLYHAPHSDENRSLSTQETELPTDTESPSKKLKVEEELGAL